MSTRLVDPVHFFNARGMSTMTEDHYLTQIKDLEERLEAAENNCKTLARRLKAIAEARS